MISDKFKCIFIHIPKNAGTSIESKICSAEGTENLLPDHRTIRDLEPISISKLLFSYQKEQLFSTIRRVKYFAQKKDIGSYYRPTSPYRYKRYYKFSVVRNSWSRVYSWYRNVMSDINHRNRYKVPHDCSFEQFVLNHLDNHPALRPQIYWLNDSNGDIPMDFICRFENLQIDFSKVAKTIGLSDSTLPKKRWTGKSGSYKAAFNHRTKDIIWKFYAKEIKYFGFEFGE